MSSHKLVAMASGAMRTDRRARQIRRVLVGLLFANLVVVVAKIIVGFTTGSLAIVGDAVHSSVDAMNNVMALALSWLAVQDPDEDHPYGHQKFETLGALAIVIFLSITGFEVVKGAIGRLIGGAPPIHITGTELSILVGTLAINTVVAFYETRRGKELESHLLLADAAHTRADVFITIGVIAGVLLSRAGLAAADPAVALVVAGAIVVIAFGIVKRAIPVLVDEHVVGSHAVQAAAESVNGVHQAYDIRSRGTPGQRFAELTIAVTAQATVEEAHQIADMVEENLRRDLRLHEIVVHIEPC